MLYPGHSLSGVLPLCRGAVGVFYSLSRLGKFLLRFSFLCYVQVFSCAVSTVCHLTYSNSFSSSNFCFLVFCFSVCSYCCFWLFLFFCLFLLLFLAVFVFLFVLIAVSGCFCFSVCSYCCFWLFLFFCLFLLLFLAAAINLSLLFSMYSLSPGIGASRQSLILESPLSPFIDTYRLCHISIVKPCA